MQNKTITPVEAKEKIKDFLNMSQYMMSVDELFTEAKERRQSIDHKNLCTLWIASVDNVMKWFLPSELVVIWAGSWSGKTQIAMRCAEVNAMKGKRVAFFMLEGDTDEIYQRYMFSRVSKKIPTNPVDFSHNIDPTGAVKEEEERCFANIPNEYKENIKIFKKTAIPTMDLIIQIISGLESTIDLIIIDHAQYIEYGEDKSESAALSMIMNKAKSLTDILRIPVVMFSHVVKPDIKSRKENITASLLTKWHLHGSSNIYKQANTVLMIEPLNDSSEKYVKTKNNEIVTRISILKWRVSSGASRIDTYMLFDRNTYEYTKEIPYDFLSEITNF